MADEKRAPESAWAERIALHFAWFTQSPGNPQTAEIHTFARRRYFCTLGAG